MSNFFSYSTPDGISALEELNLPGTDRDVCHIMLSAALDSSDCQRALRYLSVLKANNASLDLKQVGRVLALASSAGAGTASKGGPNNGASVPTDRRQEGARRGGASARDGQCSYTTTTLALVPSGNTKNGPNKGGSSCGKPMIFSVLDGLPREVCSSLLQNAATPVVDALTNLVLARGDGAPHAMLNKGGYEALIKAQSNERTAVEVFRHASSKKGSFSESACVGLIAGCADTRRVNLANAVVAYARGR